MGAQIALYFYERYPSITKSLVLCDAPLGFQDFTESEREKFISLRRTPIEDGTDLTNMATIKDWSINVVVVDMIWGGLLTGFSSFVSIALVKNFFTS